MGRLVNSQVLLGIDHLSCPLLQALSDSMSPVSHSHKLGRWHSIQGVFQTFTRSSKVLRVELKLPGIWIVIRFT